MFILSYGNVKLQNINQSINQYWKRHRFIIQFIIIALKSVYGIEQLVNGSSYASDVLGIILTVNRYVNKLRNIDRRNKTRIV
jgi:hypothetical protein